MVKADELVRKLFSQAKLYDKEFDRWHKESKGIARRYRCEKGIGAEIVDDGSAWFNLYWASLQTALPSLYARTPIVQVERRYKDSDPVARQSAEILERAARYEVGNFDFDGNVKAAVLDRLLFCRGLARVFYEPTFGVGPDGSEVKVRESVRIGYVQVQDFKHSTGRTWEEVTQVRFRSYLSKEEALARFGKEKAAKLKYTHTPEAFEDEKHFDKSEGNEFRKAEVWEVWDKPTRTVVWICSECKDDVLDMKPDPLKLEGFFPIPKPLYGTLTNDSLVPVPDARQCKKLYDLLDNIEAKIGALTEDLRVSGIYDASMEEIGRLAKSDKLIPVRNYLALKQSGGLKEAIEFWPLDHVVSALSVLYEQKENTKNDIYEITGWADIMRGASDPNETAAAQQLKGRFASIRLTDSQQDVQRFCRDLIALMGEIIAEQYEPQTLMAMTGLEFIEGATPEEKQLNYIKAVELLRGEPTRRFRIDIQTDSTLAMNEALDQQARADFMQSLVGALQTVGPLFEQMPQFVPVLGEAINFVARTYKAGRAMEGAIEQAIEATKQQIAAQSEQPPQPDPKQMEIQAKMELEQFKAQQEMALQQQKANHEMTLAQAKAQLQQEQAQLKAIQEMEKTRNDILLEQARLDADIRVQEAQAAADMALKTMQAKLDAAIARRREVLKAAQETQGIDIEALMSAQVKPRAKRRRVVPRLDETGSRFFEVEDIEEPVEAPPVPTGEVN